MHINSLIFLNASPVPINYSVSYTNICGIFQQTRNSHIDMIHWIAPVMDLTISNFLVISNTIGLGKYSVIKVTNSTFV